MLASLQYGGGRGAGSRSSSKLATLRGLGVLLIVHSVLILLVAVTIMVVGFIETKDTASSLTTPFNPVPQQQQEYLIVQQMVVATTGLEALSVIMAVLTVAAGAAGCSLSEYKSSTHNMASKSSMLTLLAASLLSCIFYLVIMGFITFYEFEFFVANASRDLVKAFGALWVVLYAIAFLTLIVVSIALSCVCKYDPEKKESFGMPAQQSVPTYNNLGYTSYPLVQGIYR